MTDGSSRHTLYPQQQKANVMHFWSGAIISRSTDNIQSNTHKHCRNDAQTHTKRCTLSFRHTLKAGLINEEHQTPASVCCSSHPGPPQKNTATKKSKWLATTETHKTSGGQKQEWQLQERQPLTGLPLKEKKKSITHKSVETKWNTCFLVLVKCAASQPNLCYQHQSPGMLSFKVP